MVFLYCILTGFGIQVFISLKELQTQTNVLMVPLKDLSCMTLSHLFFLSISTFDRPSMSNCSEVPILTM